MKRDKKVIASMVVIFAIGLVISLLGILVTRNVGKSAKVISEESAVAKLNKYIKDIGPVEAELVKGTLEYAEEDNLYQELPDMTDESIVIRADTPVYAEIASSSEKTGTGYDGWLKEMVELFNRSGYSTESGLVSIQLRTVSSGQQVDYVASGKYVPTAISPSNDLFVEMLKEKGAAVEYAADSLVNNYAGFLVSNSAYGILVEKYGEASVKTLAQATADGELVTGYTNPFTSATGMNFLVTLLDSYSPGNILDTRAVEGFSLFQKNIPFVSMTTGQMRKAAEKGTFDAFVLEYQYYVNDDILKKNYRFIPFGYEHKNPLVYTGNVSSEEREIISAFVQFCKDNGGDLAEEYGFNRKPEGYKGMHNNYTGQELISAQRLYKENKDAAPIICVFVTDVSGSMAGEPLNQLKNALVNSMQYINENNYVGLISYSDNVIVNLPIGKFDMNQQSYFKGAVESLQPSGSTATYDGICVAMDMILKAKEEVPDAKTLLFVLSDGEQNTGHSLSSVTDIISGLKIPVYTIGYNATISKLQEISDINEAVCIDASSADVIYQIKQLFNANM